MLRFDKGRPLTSRSETMDQISPDMLALLNVDEERKQKEVAEIASGALFEELLQESQRLKSARKQTEGAE